MNRQLLLLLIFTCCSTAWGFGLSNLIGSHRTRTRTRTSTISNENTPASHYNDEDYPLPRTDTRLSVAIDPSFELRKLAYMDRAIEQLKTELRDKEVRQDASAAAAVFGAVGLVPGMAVALWMKHHAFMDVSQDCIMGMALSVSVGMSVVARQFTVMQGYAVARNEEKEKGMFDYARLHYMLSTRTKELFWSNEGGERPRSGRSLLEATAEDSNEISEQPSAMRLADLLTVEDGEDHVSELNNRILQFFNDNEPSDTEPDGVAPLSFSKPDNSTHEPEDGDFSSEDDTESDVPKMRFVEDKANELSSKIGALRKKRMQIESAMEKDLLESERRAKENAIKRAEKKEEKVKETEAVVDSSPAKNLKEKENSDTLKLDKLSEELFDDIKEVEKWIFSKSPNAKGDSGSDRKSDEKEKVLSKIKNILDESSATAKLDESSSKEIETESLDSTATGEIIADESRTVGLEKNVVGKTVIPEEDKICVGDLYDRAISNQNQSETDQPNSAASVNDEESSKLTTSRKSTSAKSLTKSQPTKTMMSVQKNDDSSIESKDISMKGEGVEVNKEQSLKDVFGNEAESLGQPSDLKTPQEKVSTNAMNPTDDEKSIDKAVQNIKDETMEEDKSIASAKDEKQQNMAVKAKKSKSVQDKLSQVLDTVTKKGAQSKIKNSNREEQVITSDANIAPVQEKSITEKPIIEDGSSTMKKIVSESEQIKEEISNKSDEQSTPVQKKEISKKSFDENSSITTEQVKEKLPTASDTVQSQKSVARAQTSKNANTVHPVTAQSFQSVTKTKFRDEDKTVHPITPQSLPKEVADLYRRQASEKKTPRQAASYSRFSNVSPRKKRTFRTRSVTNEYEAKFSSTSERNMSSRKNRPPKISSNANLPQKKKSPVLATDEGLLDKRSRRFRKRGASYDNSMSINFSPTSSLSLESKKSVDKLESDDGTRPFNLVGENGMPLDQNFRPELSRDMPNNAYEPEQSEINSQPEVDTENEEIQNNAPNTSIRRIIGKRSYDNSMPVNFSDTSSFKMGAPREQRSTQIKAAPPTKINSSTSEIRPNTSIRRIKTLQQKATSLPMNFSSNKPIDLTPRQMSDKPAMQSKSPEGQQKSIEATPAKASLPKTSIRRIATAPSINNSLPLNFSSNKPIDLTPRVSDEAEAKVLKSEGSTENISEISSDGGSDPSQDSSGEDTQVMTTDEKVESIQKNSDIGNDAGGNSLLPHTSIRRVKKVAHLNNALPRNFSSNSPIDLNPKKSDASSVVKQAPPKQRGSEKIADKITQNVADSRQPVVPDTSIRRINKIARVSNALPRSFSSNKPINLGPKLESPVVTTEDVGMDGNSEEMKAPSDHKKVENETEEEGKVSDVQDRTSNDIEGNDKNDENSLQEVISAAAKVATVPLGAKFSTSGSLSRDDGSFTFMQKVSKAKDDTKVSAQFQVPRTVPLGEKFSSPTKLSLDDNSFAHSMKKVVKPPSSSEVKDYTAKTGSDDNDESIERKPDNNIEEGDNEGGKASKETVSTAYQTRTVPLGATYSSSSSLSLNDTSFSYPREVPQKSVKTVGTSSLGETKGEASSKEKFQVKASKPQLTIKRIGAFGVDDESSSNFFSSSSTRVAESSSVFRTLDLPVKEATKEITKIEGTRQLDEITSKKEELKYAFSSYSAIKPYRPISISEHDKLKSPSLVRKIDSIQQLMIEKDNEIQKLVKNVKSYESFVDDFAAEFEKLLEERNDLKLKLDNSVKGLKENK